MSVCTATDCRLISRSLCLLYVGTWPLDPVLSDFFFFLDSMQDFETALMVAARKGRVKIVKKLIQYGANVNLINKVT